LLGNTHLEKIIQTSTNTKLKSFLVGFIATILIQSSSGVTAIVVTFIASEYLSYRQGLGIMIGANLGTCITAFLVGINIQEWSLIIIILATIALIIFKSRKSNLIAGVFLGIGVIFLGLQFMESGFTSVVESNLFSEFITLYSNNSFFAFILGVSITFLIQSSSAIVGILEQLYATKIIFLQPAIALILGSNIGTTLTGGFVVVNTNYETRKAVVSNIIFNLLGAILFLLILSPYAKCIEFLEETNFISSPQIAIASAHLFFNLITVILAYWFFDQLVNITEIIYPYKANKKPLFH